MTVLSEVIVPHSTPAHCPILLPLCNFLPLEWKLHEGRFLFSVSRAWHTLGSSTSDEAPGSFPFVAPAGSFF